MFLFKQRQFDFQPAAPKSVQQFRIGFEWSEYGAERYQTAQAWEVKSFRRAERRVSGRASLHSSAQVAALPGASYAISCSRDREVRGRGRGRVCNRLSLVTASGFSPRL